MGMMSIWKAPCSHEIAEVCGKFGFQQEHLDDPACMGMKDYGYIFFARDRQLAERFAACYKAGIIQVIVDENEYRRLQKIERPIRPERLIEILIAYSDLNALNRMSVERRWHPC